MSRFLNIDVLIDEQNRIMEKTYDSKDPSEFLKFGTARMLKIWLLRKYAEQEGNDFTGEWVKGNCGELQCSICGIKRSISELNGTCTGCGAIMNKEENT